MQRHNVFIAQLLNATGKFNIDINCPFRPDEMKVKQVSFTGVALVGAYRLECNKLTGAASPGVPLSTMIDPSVIHVGITFPMIDQPKGTYDFSVVNAIGAVDPQVDQAKVTVHLEFRRFT